jgi:hypothetical protein
MIQLCAPSGNRIQAAAVPPFTGVFADVVLLLHDRGLFHIVSIPPPSASHPDQVGSA